MIQAENALQSSKEEGQVRQGLESRATRRVKGEGSLFVAAKLSSLHVGKKILWRNGLLAVEKKVKHVFRFVPFLTDPLS